MSYAAWIGRKSAIVLGSVLACLGLLGMGVSAASSAGAAEGSSVALLLGGGLAIAGVVRLMTALSADERRPRVHPADPSDPRWHGGSGEVQLAGRPCVECGRRITVATEGVACDVCAAPAHVDCEDLHRTHAHRPEPSALFR